ncbi:helicase-related protein [Pseudomonas sichuanensis]|uniref:helicase-related protein n=1 Tax=Pseudomonas TaxID=286 RepID=UPI0036F10FED
MVQDRYKNFSRIISQPSIDGKFLVYRYRKQYVEDTAKKLADSKPYKDHNQELTDYLANSISPKWDLIDCLKKGVGFHHGGMPRHIQDLIVDEFNNNSSQSINYLFCTTSLTEGINSAAKNVVIYDKKMGTGDPLGTLDRKNIEGRAGRFMQHFIGRIFYLETDETEDEPSVVEIEYLDKAAPDIETLLQLDRIDIPLEKNHLHDEFIKKLERMSIPDSLLRSNRFVSVEGQIRLIHHLRNSRKEYSIEDQYIKKEVQTEILSTIFDFLFNEKDKGKSFNNEIGKSILIQLTNYYTYHKPSFKLMLNSDTVKKQRTSENARIRFVFDLYTKYFEFTWPKYIKAFESIYNFTAIEKGNAPIHLDMLVAQLEYGTTKPHEIILRDTGLPNEIIGKISSFYKNCKTFEDVQRVTQEQKSKITKDIHSIEIKVIEKYL